MTLLCPFNAASIYHHVLLILISLQASIDYVRYLEDCISKLKEQNNRTSPPTAFGPPPTARPSSYAESRSSSPDDEGDTAMADPLEPISSNTSPILHPVSQAHVQAQVQAQAQTTYPSHPSSYHPSTSPHLLPQDSRRRTDSYSSYTSSARHYSFSTSATTSPCFGTLNSHGYTGYGGTAYPESLGGHSNPGSALTSPALGPQRSDVEELDREATAALLMLGGSGRTMDRGRGISVKDLLV